MITLRQINLIYLHLSVLLFGFSGLFVQLSALSAWQLVAFRTLFAALFLLVISLWITTPKDHIPKPPRYWLKYASGALLAFHWFCFFYAIELSSVALGLITFASFPLFILIIERFYFQTALTRNDYLAFLLILAGLACLVSPKALETVSLSAVCFGLLSGLSFALLSLLNRQLITHHHPIHLACWQNGLASLCLLPWLYVEWQAPSLTQWLWAMVLGVVCTAIAHTLFITSLKHIPIRTASLATCLEPLYGIVLAFLLFDQWPDFWVGLGGISILSGVFLNQSQSKSRH